MIAPAVLWPCALGSAFLAAGLCMYWREVAILPPRSLARLTALAPVFIASALAAFAGEHFTLAKELSAMVPKFLPGRLFIAYFVGVAHLAAALSFVARRCMKWSALLLAIMFAGFVLLLHFPGALRNPGVRVAWVVTVRETTFALGALAVLRTVQRSSNETLATVTRYWTACVLIFFGVLHFVHPELSPGVPDSMATPKWVPLPMVVAYAVGVLLIVFGGMMLAKRYSRAGATYAGSLMLVLTLCLYLPLLLVVRGVGAQVNALNFVFDTLLFAGTMLAIAAAEEMAR